MRALHKKLWRELWHTRYQVLAIVLVMTCGVATVVMSLSTLDSLEQTRGSYYQETHFAHIFAHVKRAPLALVERLREIPGVSQVEPRVAVSVTLDVRGMVEPATAQVISLPDFHPPALNELHLRAGRWLEPNRPREALVTEAFASAHGLLPGDRLSAIINGRLQELQIVGIVLSPEFIYAVRPGELLPDDKRFGVLWMNYTELATAFDLDGAFNDVLISLLPGAEKAEVMRRVDRLLDPYGCQGSFDRAEQASYKFLDNEMVQLRSMALLPPAIFLTVSAFLLHVVLSRLIATEREQIAALRAFGYTQREIALHYLAFGGLIVTTGSLGGLALGAWFGQQLTLLYTQFFHFPVFDYQLDPRIAVTTCVVSGAAALSGALGSVWRASRQPPAQAMQPEPPARFRASVVERLGMQRLLSPAARMVCRHLERQPLRALMSCLGIALAIAILIMGNFMVDTVDYVMDLQFHVSQRQSIMVSFVEPTAGQAMHDLRSLPGVLQAEPFRSTPTRLRFGHHTRRLAILGLQADAELFRLIDRSEQHVLLPPEGLVISQKLAECLACKVGDRIQVAVLEGSRPVRDVPIAAVVSDFIELNAYMEINALRRLLREQDSVSGAFLWVDAPATDALYSKLKQTPRVAGVSIKQAVLDSYERTMAENLLRMRVINVLFAAALACGVVYNSARIALAERSRELATLRVLGFTRREVSFILLGELALLVGAAIPLGMLLGYQLALVLVRSLDTEVHRFPLVINSSTYALAVTVTVLAALASALLVRRRLDHFDLVAVLKTRD